MSAATDIDAMAVEPGESAFAYDDGFILFEWDEPSAEPRETNLTAFVDLEMYEHEASLSPTPPYEACTPSDTCMDSESKPARPLCKFIKFAGDPEFDERAYLRQFHSVQWQRPWRDPDCKPREYSLL